MLNLRDHQYIFFFGESRFVSMIDSVPEVIPNVSKLVKKSVPVTCMLVLHRNSSVKFHWIRTEFCDTLTRFAIRPKLLARHTQILARCTKIRLHRRVSSTKPTQQTHIPTILRQKHTTRLRCNSESKNNNQPRRLTISQEST